VNRTVPRSNSNDCLSYSTDAIYYYYIQVVKITGNHKSLPNLVQTLRDIYTGQVNRHLDKSYKRANSVKLSNPLLDAKTIEDRLTSHACKLIKHEMNKSAVYLPVRDTNFTDTYTVRRDNQLPGQSEPHTYVCNISTGYCSCGFRYTKHRLLACRHLIAVARRAYIPNTNEYDIIIRFAHPRWSKNAEADIQDYGFVKHVHQTILESSRTLLETDAPWKRYFTSTQRFNEIVNVAKAIATSVQNHQHQYELVMNSLIRTRGWIDNNLSLPVNSIQSNIDSIFSESDHIVNVNNDSSNNINNNTMEVITVRDPPRVLHAGRNTAQTNTIKNNKRRSKAISHCSTCKQYGHKANSIHCSMRVQYIEKDNNKRVKNQDIGNRQQNYLHSLTQ